MPAIVPEDLQNQIVSAVRKGNEATVGRVKTVVGTVKTPKLPEGKLDVAKLRQGTVDYAGKLPTPVDVVEGAFGLVDRAVEQQRKLTSGVISKAGALRPGAEAKTGSDAKIDTKIDTKSDTKIDAKAEANPAAKKPAAKAASSK